MRESRLTAAATAVARFSPETAANDREFSRLLDTLGVPCDHGPLIEAATHARAVGPESPPAEFVPIEACGL